jgi:integrase
LNKLTKSYIDRLPLPKVGANGKASQAIYRDGALPGFGILVGSGGTKSFFVETRISGRVRRVSIGKYGHLTPVQARIKAQELLGSIVLGNDPAAEKRAVTAKATTLGAAFEDYLLTRKDLKPGTVKNYRKCVDGCLSDWLQTRLIDITKDMVQKRHSDIGKTAPARANNTMRVLRAVFNHALAKYEDAKGKPVITLNPVERISRTRAWYPIERRRTLIKPHELPAFFEATQELAYDVTRDYIHFLLFTGLRKSEGAGLKWSDVSLEDRTFTIPDTKNREPHTLPLSNYLFDLLKRRKDDASDPIWVFPSPMLDGPLRDPKQAMAQVGEGMGKHVTFHDLRRTFITIAESLDIPAYALKQLLNHRNPNDVTAGYIVADVNRLRIPMQVISDFITGHLNNDK